MRVATLHRKDALQPRAAVQSLALQCPKLVGITSSITQNEARDASQDVSVQNEAFACGSSSTVVRQALDKALDKTHQEPTARSNTNKVLLVGVDSIKNAPGTARGQPFDG